MRSLRLHRVVAIVALTAVSTLLPLSELNAGTRNESRWERPEPATQRIVRQASGFWQVLVSIWEKTGLRIDGNG